MLRQPMQSFVRFCFVVSCATISLVSSLNGEEHYRSYAAPEGIHYVALGLQVQEQSAEKPAEVVFLVDTSAGQMGQARLDTLQTIVSAINHLPNGTKIQIFAMDVETEPLMDQFFVKGSPEVESALKTLYRRIPLGAADFGKGLETVRKAFEDGTNDARRSVLYLGGGRSMAKTVSADVFEKESHAFTEAKIAFTACAIGLRTNFGFISAFANRTGGNLIDTAPRELKVDALDEKRVNLGLEQVDWQKIGEQVADSALATVVWIDPASVKFPEGWTVYPLQMQPIRSDRATVLVGTAESKTLPTFSLTLSGTTAEGPATLTIPLVPEAEKSSNNYLRTVVEVAAKDGGAVLPIVGWNSLLQIHELFIANVEEQINKANTALELGNPQHAMTILNDVLRAEPSNKIAQNMFLTAEEQMSAILPNVISADEGSLNGAASDARMGSPTYVDTAIQGQNHVMQKMQKEVEVAIAMAQKQALSSEPDFDAIAQELKLLQQMVRNNGALLPASREVLVDRLGNSIKHVEQKKFESEYRDVQEAMRVAAVRARQETLNAVQADREKATQIFARFRALLDTGEFKAATAVADTAIEVLPDHPGPYFARRLAQMRGYIAEYEEIRHKRHIGFLETFMDAERSFIPIPAEPPITYIDRDRWKLLSDYRKEKYSSIALSDPDESIKTIKAILENRDIRLNIDETTTFSDLFRMIKDELKRLKLPDINIGMDVKALQDAGEYRSDSIIAPEGFDHPRMRLRSVLSRLLSPLDLTCIIRDETLLITTVEESKKRENMFIKVYPIGDIFMLESGGGMMGGMGGGMMGGMGGGMMGGMGGGMMGGMGGGMGGMSGGMGGMSGGMGGMSGGMGGMSGGMGGMGGGRYSLPDEITRSTASRTDQLLQNANAAEDCNAFWSNYFAQEDIAPDTVRDVARRLSRAMQTDGQIDKQSADQVVALVEAAILSGNAQPWMYEALTLSLHFKEAPKDQVLRAALSAADLCETPLDLLNVGFVMRTVLDLKQHAFPLYQHALENLPPKRDLYAATLRLAEELFDQYNDEESLRWIGLAILSQEWDGALGAKLMQDANNALTTLSNRLIKQERVEELQLLAEQIRDAKLRDCVVTIEWTGDAGIDLMVLEPSNSLCWFKNPRSLSGGLLKTTPTTISTNMNNRSSVKRTSYVCPRGFNGNYSLILHKSWGNLSNNLVNVTVETNLVPGENQSEAKAVHLEPEGIKIDFALETGRRTESASEAELAAADMQTTIAQRVVDRNTALWRLQDDGLLGRQMILAQDDGGGDGGGGGGGGDGGNGTTNITVGGTTPTILNPDIGDYLRGTRYVGYAPDVTLLDVGAFLFFGPQDVAVSPDRRYVFMRVQQQYTTLRSVGEYNTLGGGFSGDSGTGNTGGNNNNMGSSTGSNNNTGNNNNNSNNNTNR